jgi:hypothetical protein
VLQRVQQELTVFIRIAFDNTEEDGGEEEEEEGGEEEGEEEGGGQQTYMLEPSDSHFFVISIFHFLKSS